MIDRTDVDGGAAGGILGVAAQAKVCIGLDQHFPVDGTVWVMTGGATFAQRFVFEHDRPGLFPMTLGTTFVPPRHCQPARRFENVGPMRIMALHAVHAAFENGVMLRQTEFNMRLQMALKACGGVLAGVHDEFAASAARRHMQAAGTMAGFAAALTGHGSAFDMDASVGTGREYADVVCVAIRTAFVAHVMRAGDFRGCKDGLRDRGARIEQQRPTGHGATNDCYAHCLL